MSFIRTSRHILHPDSGMQHPVASEITPRAVHDDRRRWLKAAGIAGSGLLLGDATQAWAQGAATPRPGKLAVLAGVRSSVSGAQAMDKLTPYQDVSSYNNFYEFGTDKGDPAEHAGTLKPRPWALSIEGEVGKPLKLGLDDLLKVAPMEERIYRLRCVEGWSMVIPWVGYSLAALIARAEPTSRAKYVEFISLADPKQMPGVRSAVLDWPYVEGLRIDEAMHPLTLMAFGLYGEVLPNQNGAPLRLVVPWKYGFKSAKSIVKIRFVEQQPRTAWVKAAAQEYGFYSNVNPDVDHPRWSQKTEKRLPAFFANRKTEMFNGYGDQVAKLYAGMDLKKFY